MFSSGQVEVESVEDSYHLQATPLGLGQTSPEWSQYSQPWLLALLGPPCLASMS